MRGRTRPHRDPGPDHSPNEPHRDSQARFAPLFPSALVQRVPGSAHDTIPFFADTGHAVVLFLAAVAGVPLRLDALLRGRARFAETRLAMEGARLAFRKVWAARYATDDFRLPPGAAADGSGDSGSGGGGGAAVAQRGRRRRRQVFRHGAADAISPFEIEEALRRHGAVGQALAFELPRAGLRGTVGAVLVPAVGGGPRGDGDARPSVHALREAVRDELAPCWWPDVVVWAEALPTGAAGQHEREGLARRLESLGLELSGSDGPSTWDTVGPVAAGADAAPLRRRPPDAAALAAGEAAPAAAAPRALLEEGELRERVVRAVRAFTHDQSVHDDTPLMDAGVDSLDATRLATQLGELTGVEILPTLIFDGGTPRGVARLLFRQIQPAPTPRAGTTAATMPLAVAPRLAGMSALLPCGIDGAAAAWRMAAAGSEVIGEVPAARWELPALPRADDLTALRVRHGGFVRGAERFDNARLACRRRRRPRWTRSSGCCSSAATRRSMRRARARGAAGQRHWGLRWHRAT